MSVWVRVLAGLVRAPRVHKLIVLDAAVRTFLLPRIANVRFSRLVARGVGSAFGLLVASQ